MRRTIEVLPTICLGLVLAVFVGCATTQSRFSPLSAERYPPLPDTYNVEVFQQGAPTKAYVEIARLDVHLEVTHFIRSDFDNALPELKKQARQSGSHAIIKIEERRSRVGETMIYHVTATGIRYTDK